MKFDLVFEGGGAKGMVFVGALEAFGARKYEVGRLLGTSAGAIVATGLAAGYSEQEIQDALTETVDGVPVFETFMAEPPLFDSAEIDTSALLSVLQSIDLPWVPNFLEDGLDRQLARALLLNPRYRHFTSFVERGGWYSAHTFEEWLTDKLNSGSDHGKPRAYGGLTLAEFFGKTGKHLSLIAADTEASRLLVLNHITAPNVPLVSAVRMSMNFPLLWQEVVWQEGWGTYLGMEMAGHTIVDGGLLSNFPIELFISDDKHITDLMGPKLPDAEVLGFLIDETLAVADAPPREKEDGWASNSAEILRQLPTAQRIDRLIDTTTQAHDKMVIDTFAEWVCHLPAKGYGTTEFDMTIPRRDALVNAGRISAESYFTTRADQLAKGGIDFDVGELETAMQQVDRIANSIFAP